MLLSMPLLISSLSRSCFPKHVFWFRCIGPSNRKTIVQFLHFLGCIDCLVTVNCAQERNASYRLLYFRIVGKYTWSVLEMQTSTTYEIIFIGIQHDRIIYYFMVSLTIVQSAETPLITY